MWEKELIHEKKLSTEEENVPVINSQLSEDNTDIDLVVTSCTDFSVKDTENQLLKQELNETKNLLLKHQMDLQSCLSCQVNNIKNMFSFNRIKNSDKDVNFYTGLKNAKVFLWVVKRIEKHVTIIHKKLSLADHVLIVLMTINLQRFHKYVELLVLLLANARRISLYGQTKEQLEGHFQNVLKSSFMTAFAL